MRKAATTPLQYASHSQEVETFVINTRHSFETNKLSLARFYPAAKGALSVPSDYVGMQSLINLIDEELSKTRPLTAYSAQSEDEPKLTRQGYRESLTWWKRRFENKVRRKIP